MKKEKIIKKEKVTERVVEKGKGRGESGGKLLKVRSAILGILDQEIDSITK